MFLVATNEFVCSFFFKRWLMLECVDMAAVRLLELFVNFV